MRTYPKREATPKSGLYRCCRKLEVLDQYGEEFKFFVGGKKKTKSFIGIVASVLLGLFMLFYFYQRLEIMYGYKGTKILQTAQLEALDVDFVFNETSAFRIAFALTAYDGKTTITEDPRKAVLKPYLRSWGIPENNGKIVDYSLETRPCKPEELNIEESDDPNFTTDFFPVMENSFADAEVYGRKMKCLNYEEFEFFGNFNSYKAKQPTLYLEMCMGGAEKGCEEEADIKEWLRDKYILVLSNQMVFDAERYDTGKIKSESMLTWFKVNT